MLDFTVRYDKKVVVGPEEASVVPGAYCCFDVHERGAVVAVIDEEWLSRFDHPAASISLPILVVEFSRVAMSQTVAVQLYDADTSRVESGEKSTADQ